MSDGCFECLRQRQRILEKIKKLKTDQDCFDVAAEIYDYIEKNPGSVLEGKRLTFKIPSSELGIIQIVLKNIPTVERKQSKEEV